MFAFLNALMRALGILQKSPQPKSTIELPSIQEDEKEPEIGLESKTIVLEKKPEIPKPKLEQPIDTTRDIKEFDFGKNTELNLYTWKKGTDAKLSSNFTTYEFECRCNNPSCIDQIISIELVDKLQRLREALGEPIRINSGYRCQTHQEELTRKGLQTAQKSTHVIGHAADIQRARGDSGKDATIRFNKLLTICETLFKAIGIGSGWLHVDLRSDKKRRWTY